MKKSILLLTSILVTFSASAGWMDDWYDSNTASDPSHYNNQKRGFYSLGGYQARLNLTNDYPASIELPRISAGCGGIDIFAGGLSFLDEDFLVEKFQNIIQAAPALAFDMALKHLSPQLEAGMTKLTELEQRLNNMQLDDCAMSKRLVAEIADGPSGDVLGGMWSEVNSKYEMEQASAKNYTQTREKVDANDGKPTVDLNTAISACPQNIKDIFTQGSLLQNIMSETSDPQYTDLVRGIIGDVTLDTTSEKLPAAHIQSRCANNTSNLSDMKSGLLEKKSPGGVCTRDTNSSVLMKTLENMDSIAVKLKDGVGAAPLSNGELVFIQNTTLPVLEFLKQGVQNGDVDSTITLTHGIIASDTSYYIFEELLRNLTNTLTMINNDVNSVKSKNIKNCDIKVFSDPIYRITKLYSEASKTRDTIKASYDTEMNSFVAQMQLIQIMDRNSQSVLQKTLVETRK